MAKAKDQDALWIQLEQHVAPKDWTTHNVQGSEYTECGVKTQIVYFMDPRRIEYDYCKVDECKFCHRRILFDFFISTTAKSDHLHMRLCYNPTSWEDRKNKTEFDQTTNNKHTHYWRCYSYIWIFDNCFVKMHFRDPQNPSRVITKRFQIKPESGGCGSPDHLSASIEEFAFFKDNKFILKKELEDEIGYKIENQKQFVPVDIEIRAKLRSIQLRNNYNITNYAIYTPSDLGNSNNSSFFKTAKVFTPSGNPFIRSNAFRPKCASKRFFQNPDITFQIGSGPEVFFLNVHSCILQAQSPVFSAMLSADMREKQSGVIKLEDFVEKGILKLFLKMIYEQTGWVYSSDKDSVESLQDTTDYELSMASMLKVLQLAHLYQVASIIDFCLDCLISYPDSELTFKLAVEMSKMSVLYNQKDLGSRSSEWIKRQFNSTRSNQFKEEVKMMLKEECSDQDIDFVAQLLP